MKLVGSLRRSASKNFALPGFGSRSTARARAKASGMPLVFYPNGLSCWQVNAYLIHCHRTGLKVQTIATYASELSLFVRYLHRLRLEPHRVDDDHLIEFADWMADRATSSNRHINRILARVIAFLEWFECISPRVAQVGRVGDSALVAVERRPLKSSGRARVRVRHVAMLPSGAKRVVRPMPVTVFHQLLSQCKSVAQRSFCKARSRIMLLLLADTGIRREELVWIGVRDIEAAIENGGRLSVRTSKRKGNPMREVPVPELTLREVAKYIQVQRALLMRRHERAGRAGREKGWLVCTESGGRLAASSVTQLFSDLRHLAGVSERATAHMLRHRYITLQVMDRIRRLRSVGVLGVEAASTVLAQVASLSGHSSPESMWDYIDWAYQEMATLAEEDGDSEVQLLIDELEVFQGAGAPSSMGAELIFRLQQALKSRLGTTPKLGVLAHQAGSPGSAG